MIGIIVYQKHGVKIQLVYETELLYYLQLANSSIISQYGIKGLIQEIEQGVIERWLFCFSKNQYN